MDKDQVKEIIKQYLKENMNVGVRVRTGNSMWNDSQVPSVEVEIYLDNEIICSYEG